MQSTKTSDLKVSDVRYRQLDITAMLDKLDSCILDHGSYELPQELMPEVQRILKEADEMYECLINNTVIF